MPPAVGTKYNGYRAYLRYKTVIEMMQDQGEFTRDDMARVLGVPYELTLHMASTLLQEKVIKVCRFDISSGHKKAVYKEITYG